MIIWRDRASASPSLPSESIGNVQLLEDGRFEYLENVLREEHAAAGERAAAVEASRWRPDPKDQYVFIDCVMTDVSDLLNDLKPKFDPSNIRIKPPFFGGQAELRLQKDRQFLEVCDGVGVFWGTRHDLDAWMACQSLEESVGERQVPKAIIIKPDTDPVRQAFIYPGFKTHPIHSLSEFIGQVLGQRTPVDGG